MGELVRFEVSDGVGLITLDRPDRLNAFNGPMHGELDAVFAEAHRSTEAKVIVLTGSGRGFCAGADLDLLDGLAEARGSNYFIPPPGTVVPAFEGLDGLREAMTTYTFPLAMPKPVIAAVNGPSVGIGFVLAAACDIRFVSRKASFSAAFPQIGVVAEYGIAWLLPRVIGRNLAADLLLSGRRLDAEEAHRIGFASRIEEPEEMLPAALAYARGIAANCSPNSTRMIKQQLIDAETESYAQATRKAYGLLVESLGSADFAEGLAAIREKRAPHFTEI